MSVGKTPADQVHIDVSLVRQLVAAQFPQWADLPIKPVEHDGWDNRTFQLISTPHDTEHKTCAA